LAYLFLEEQKDPDGSISPLLSSVILSSLDLLQSKFNSFPIITNSLVVEVQDHSLAPIAYFSRVFFEILWSSTFS